MIQEDVNDLITEKTFEEEQVTETSDVKGVRIEDAGDLCMGIARREGHSMTRREQTPQYQPPYSSYSLVLVSDHTESILPSPHERTTVP
jgi:hypothetical protein